MIDTTTTSSTYTITQNQLLKKKQRLDKLEETTNQVLESITSSNKEVGWMGLVKSAMTFIVFIMAQSILAKIKSDQDALVKEAYEAGQTDALNHGNADNLEH